VWKIQIATGIVFGLWGLMSLGGAADGKKSE